MPLVRPIAILLFALATSVMASADWKGQTPGYASSIMIDTTIEGPSICKVGNAYHLYYDYFQRNRYDVSRSTDLKTWTEITDQLAMPPLASHGRVFPVSGEVVKNLIRRDDERLAVLAAAISANP